MSVFKFKQFEIKHCDSAMKVGTDGVLLGAWSEVENTRTIVDIGTGCGVIALMLAQRCPSAKVSGVEIDKKASIEARYNAERSPFTDRVDIRNASIQDFADEATATYDLIVCNPPFFTGGTMTQQAGREVARHTTKLSHNDLLTSARRLISKEGRFNVVLPFIEGHQFLNIAKTYGFHPIKITEVRPKANKKIERLLISLSQTPSETIEDELVIQFEGRNNYTPEYIEYTKDFYLNM